MSENKIPIAKAQNEELRQGLYVVLEPDVVDAHGDTISADEIRKSCHNFNKSLAKANLFHLVNTDSFSVVESFVAPVAMELNGQILKAGTWLVNLQFSEALWEDVKADKFSGVSIGAMGIKEDIE